jgi:hypothetical protein
VILVSRPVRHVQLRLSALRSLRPSVHTQWHQLVRAALSPITTEYECEFQSPLGYLYDVKSLCGASPYSFPANAQPTDTVYSFQICGTSSTLCAPEGYRVEFNYASAMQFFGDLPAANVTCTDNFNNVVPCTRACEVLGAGALTGVKYIRSKACSFGGGRGLQLLRCWVSVQRSLEWSAVLLSCLTMCVHRASFV